MNRARTIAAAALSPLIWWRERSPHSPSARPPEAIPSKNAEGRLAGMLHELRTPLAAMAGLVNLLLEESFDELQQKALLTRVAATVAAMDMQVKNAFDLHLLEQGRLRTNRRPSRPAQLIEESVARCAPAAQVKQLEIDAQLPELPAIELDPLHLDRIVCNLVFNAIRRTAHGRITVSVSVVNDHLALEIVDEGGPVALDQLPQFFERVESGAGAPNELFTARILAEIDGGSARAANRDGRGVAVTVLLPLGASGA